MIDVEANRQRFSAVAPFLDERGRRVIAAAEAKAAASGYGGIAAVSAAGRFITHYWSRAKTPKDNAGNERFNRTVQDEFIAMGNMITNPEKFVIGPAILPKSGL